MSFFGFSIHRGVPDLPTKLRAYTGTLLTKDDPKEGINNFTDHKIAKWYGVSFGLRWFVGVWIFGDTDFASERGKVPR